MNFAIVNASRRRTAPVGLVRQRGQVLALGLALFTVGMAGLLFMFDIGQTISHKTRLVNAADAAAFSAATWRARVFNYVAYSNRAIIAQEVFVAQAITLDSWSQYFHETTRTIRQIANIFPPARAVTQVVEQVARAAREATGYAAATETRLRDAPHYGYKALLQHSQQVLKTAAGPFGASAVALEVAKANDQRIFAFALSDHGQYKNFTRHYRSDAERQRLKSLVMRSLDQFTGGPRGEDQPTYAPTACTLVATRTADRFQHFRKRGGTIMTPDLNRWEAADTASLHSNRRSFFSRRCRPAEILPFGWGAAELSSQARPRSLRGDPGGARLNRTAFDRASAALGRSDGSSYAGSGIARVHDLNYQVLGSDTRYPSSRIAVLARLPAAKLRLSAAAGVGAGRLRKDGAWPGKNLWAIAAAEAYFKRPPGAPRRIEYASLYSPYWQARLVAVTDEERNGVDLNGR